ncbi:glycosyltransferase family 4 protein [Aequorivita viscosa]|uniref:glycosyltransferase family 4 protein n=1 Tax=Aequorivita viscosa TaxID=797419 RepID=UPI001356417E|nr:glycosyltransferase family 4 protein [Aequorivita viscosa]
MALEKGETKLLRTRLKKLISNNFILRYKTDWLHFGFGTMALGRENIAQVTGAKMAVSFRGFDIGIYPLKHPGCYQKLFQKVDKIHVISDDIAELLYGQGLENKQIITKITPAINTTFFTQSTRNESAAISFLTVGRLHWKKGFVYTLEALSILKNQGVDFIYTIIGEGIEYEQILYATHQLGIENNVKFAGKLPHAEVKKHLEEATIYLQYSIQEGFCNAVLEAQAMGLLCIVSDAEGLSENVLDNQTGWVVPKRRPLLLADKIKEVLALDTKRKNEIAEKAIQRVKNEFNIEKQTQEFVDFYKL